MAIGSYGADLAKRAGLKHCKCDAQRKVVKSPEFVGDFRIKRNGVYSVWEAVFWRPGWLLVFLLGLPMGDQ